MTFRIRKPARALGARAALIAAVLAAGAPASAHTGHGHAEFGSFEGLLHALREPDHLVMIALGLVVIGAVSPLVLRAAAWLGRRVVTRVRAARGARRGAAR